MNDRWLFILGRQADIAAAEVAAALKNQHIQYTPQRAGRHELIIKTDADLGDPQVLLNRLGGTIKIIKIDAEVPLAKTSEFKEALNELLKTEKLVQAYQDPNARKQKERWTFGISTHTTYVAKFSKKNERELSRVVHNLGLKIKSDLKSLKRSARFVAARGRKMDLSSVVVRKNKLLGASGAEIVLLMLKDRILRGRTLAVQDFEAYGRRDFGRPARDPKKGSLPPKLAQMLINLAQVEPGGSIHDPFVGQGTILQEGLLLGYQMSGTDSSVDQVKNAEKNLKWFLKDSGLKEMPKVWQAQAQKFKPPAETLNAIVTEGVLGPPHSKPLPVDTAKKISLQIASVWQSVLTHVYPLLSSTGKIMATWPVFVEIGDNRRFLPLLDELENLGYRLETVLPPGLATKDQAEPRGLARGTLIYERPGQVVLREVIKLSKLESNGT